MATSTSGTFTATGSSAGQNHSGGGLLALSISGTFAATVDLQRSFDSGGTYQTIVSYTAPTEVNIEAANPSVRYRVNCTWTSGTVTYYLGHA